MDHCKSVSVIWIKIDPKIRNFKNFCVCECLCGSVRGYLQNSFLCNESAWFLLVLLTVRVIREAHLIGLVFSNGKELYFGINIESNKWLQNSRFKIPVKCLFFVVSVCWRWWNSIGELLFFFFAKKILFPHLDLELCN